MNNNIKMNQQQGGKNSGSVVTLMFPGNDTLSESLSERTINTGNRKAYNDNNITSINSPTDTDVDAYIRKIFLRSKSLPQEGGDVDEDMNAAITSSVNLSDFDIDGADDRDTMTGGSSSAIRTFFLNNMDIESDASEDIYLSDDADYGDQFGGYSYDRNEDDDELESLPEDDIQRNIKLFFLSRK